MTMILATYPREVLAGTLMLSLAITVQTWLMGIAVIGLDILLLAALLLWSTHSVEIVNLDITQLYFTAVAIQCFHFLEEFTTGFQIKFPQFFGYEWSDQQFISLNLVWLGILILNGVWLTSKKRLSYLLAFFVAIAMGIANGIGHPLLSLIVRGYFPGLITSPLDLVVGVVLFRKLIKSR